jgi:hypothetical protein
MRQTTNSWEPSKKLIYSLMGMLLIYAVARSLVAAAGKSFWFDELLTVIVTSQGTWSAIVKSLHAPLDGQPPLFYMIETLTAHSMRNQEIAYRLPSIIALVCTLACVFVYTRRRSGDLVAFLCALFLLMTSAFQYYAVEARPYSMVVALIAFAMVCYQRALSPLWTILLGISVAFAQFLHYLAILAILPFALAELVFLWGMRKFRWPVWAALVFSALPILLCWNLITLNKSYFGPHHWAQFQFTFIPRTYGDFFQANSSSLGAAIGAVALAGAIGVVLWPRSPKGELEDREPHIAALAQGTLLFALTALPFGGYLFTVVTHSGMTSRYILATAVGIATASGFMLSRAKPGAIALFGVFVLSSVGVHELHFWRFYREDIDALRSRGGRFTMLLDAGGHKDLPIVFPEGSTMLELIHYAPSSSTNRFVLLTEKGWSDTVDKVYVFLPSYLPVHVEKLSEFASANKEFLMYTEGDKVGRDWLTYRFTPAGWSFRPLVIDVNPFRGLYLVSPTEILPSQMNSISTEIK